MNRRSSFYPNFIAAAFLGLPLSLAYGQVQVAEDLIINLDASTYTNGFGWNNSGSAGSAFLPSGTPTRLNNISGQSAVYFDESEWFTGPPSVATLDAAQASYSIEAWAYQGYLRREETLVSWGNRGTENINVSLNYGFDARWGAMGHWGGADIGFGPNDPNGFDGRAPGTPPEGQWHLITYTYDGAGTQKVYLNGALVNQESGLNLDPFDGRPIRIGGQTNAAGAEDGGNRLGGAISKVRVHGGVLTDAQVQQNYELDAAAYRPAQKATQFLTLGPKHRYTFNNLASAADGTVVLDIAGGADATIRGFNGSVVSNTGLSLGGGASGTAAYVDLPNGVASGKFGGGAGYSSVSYEAWVTVNGNGHWSRIMDFGTTNAGEIGGPGGGFNGTNYFFLSANTDSNPNVQIDRGGEGFVGAASRQTQGNNLLGQLQHVVATYDADNDEWKWFQNGILMEGFSSPFGPDSIPDVNNWLGRSNWSGDANLNGAFDEFRIYDYALNLDQVSGNFAAGPDVVNVPEPSSALLAAAAAAGLAGRRNRRRPV
jgi:MYXO-CTERM domain-containing protein